MESDNKYIHIPKGLKKAPNKMTNFYEGMESSEWNGNGTTNGRKDRNGPGNGEWNGWNGMECKQYEDKQQVKRRFILLT